MKRFGGKRSIGEQGHPVGGAVDLLLHLPGITLSGGPPVLIMLKLINGFRWPRAHAP